MIIAVPVAPRDTVDRVKQIVGNNDKVVVLYSAVSFTAVGQFYADFGQVSDSQVKKIMKKHGYKNQKRLKPSYKLKSFDETY